MNPLTPRKPSKYPDTECTELMVSAERELAAFFRAVKELFGPEQAEHSAQDWLRELEAKKTLPASGREWRSITTTVARQLARRVNSLSNELQLSFAETSALS